MEKNKKLIIQRISKVICFLLIFTAFLEIGSKIFIPKKNSAEYGNKNYYGNSYHGERANSIDIVVVGNSSAYKSFSPLELWNEYGYTSFVCGAPAQKIQEGYYMLEDFLKEQKPKVVIYETEGIFNSYGKKIKSSYNQAKRDLIFLSNEIDGMNATLDVVTANICPLLKYHNRWSSLKPEDFTLEPDYSKHYVSKGYVLTNKVKPYRGNKNYMKPSDYTTPIQYTNLYYLNKMKELCDKNGAEFVLMSSPLPRAWNDERHKAVKAYAEKNNIKYLDTNLSIDEMKIDWSKDSCDKGYHLNVYGAKKNTAFVGKYLTDNFKLTDHRGDKEFSQWNKDYKSYSKKIKKLK